MIIKILASLLTGIGGHYLNRRWDKAILFLCLFILCLISGYAIIFFAWQNLDAAPREVAARMKDISKMASFVSLGGVGLAWLASIIVTIIDTKSPNQANMARWNISAVSAAVLTSILSCAILASSGVASYSLFKTKTDQSVEVEESSFDKNDEAFSSHNFFENKYFGGMPTNSYKLPAPPSGDGILRGKITFLGKPAAGVTLEIILNSQYRAKDIVTDSNGLFSLNLPVGQWRLNSIQTRSWQDKPAGQGFSLYSGDENKLTGDSYNSFGNFHNEGLHVDVGLESEEPQLVLTIAPDIALNWPDANREGINASISDTINWQQQSAIDRYSF